MKPPLIDGDPERIGEYRLERRLSAEGRSLVYLGRDRNGFQVVVKIERPGQEEPRPWLQREFDALRSVPAFCAPWAIELGRAESTSYLVMEYVRGPTLREKVTDEGVLEGESLKSIALGTAAALVAIHEAGVVYRGLAPEHIILGPRGPRLVSFGLALLESGGTLERTGEILGPPGYLAPERLTGEDSGPATDVFMWGPSRPSPHRGALRSSALTTIRYRLPSNGSWMRNQTSVLSRATSARLSATRWPRTRQTGPQQVSCSRGSARCRSPPKSTYSALESGRGKCLLRGRR